MIADGIAQYIDNQGLYTLGTNLFVSSMPDAPDDAICVYDEPGTTVNQNHYDNSDVFGTKIMFRGSHSFIREALVKVHRNIAGLGDVTLDSLYLVDTRIQTPPGDIGNDDNGRRRYTVHYDHYVKVGSNQHRNNN